MFPNLKKEISVKAQEPCRIPHRQDQKRNSPYDIIIKILNVQNKERLFLSQKLKGKYIYISIYAPNTQFIKEKLQQLKTHFHVCRVIVGDFSILLSPIERSLKEKKLNRKMLELNTIIKETDLEYICRTIHPNTKEFTFLLTAHGIFSTKLTTYLDKNKI